MKRAIVGLLLGALLCSLFSTAVFPLPYDPTKPSQTKYENIFGPYRDSGWIDPSKSGKPGDGQNSGIIVRPLLGSVWFGFIYQGLRVRVNSIIVKRGSLSNEINEPGSFGQGATVSSSASGQ
jgi:hypothetical protein